MKNDFQERQLEVNTFTQRSLFIMILLFLVIVIFLYRIFYLQILEHDEFTEAAFKNKTYTVPVQPLRGKIIDRNGIILTDNVATFDLITNPSEINDPTVFLNDINRVINLSEGEKTNFLNNFDDRAFFNKELILKSNLKEKDIAKFEVQSFRFPNAFVGKRYRRIAIGNDSFAHVLGYAGVLTDTSMISKKFNRNSWNDALYSYANGLIEGKSGLEKTFNDVLRGKFGYKQFEVDSKGRFIKEIDYLPPVKGDDLQTTLDLKAQLKAADLMQDKKGSVVAVDVKSGEIVVLLSTPTYPINKMANGISKDQYDDLLNNKDKPFFDRSVSGRYPPASTLKPFFAFHSINNQIINWENVIRDPGYFILPDNGRMYRGWRQIPLGRIDLETAIVRSSNTFFFDLAYKSNINDISDDLKKFGFGNTVCLDCFQEDNGLVPTPDWKRKNLNFNWFKGDTVNLGIGQGYMISTPVQLAHYAAIIASKGDRKKLFISELNRQNALKESITTQAFNKSDWQRLHESMLNVIESDLGTARSLRNSNEFLVAAKTGTGEVVSLNSSAEYNRIREDVSLRDHAIMIAFAPYENPKYAISVIVENGESGGGVAGPVALGVLRELLDE